jgi:hypothetical protein
MPKPTHEQMAEYEEWLKQHPDAAPSSEVARSVIDDDMAEAEEHERKRANWSREYNAKEISPASKPKLAEKE